MKGKKRIACPYCGYVMPVFYDEKSRADGIYIKCKGRNCRKIFEIKIRVK